MFCRISINSKQKKSIGHIVSILFLFVLWSCLTPTPNSSVSYNAMSVDIDARYEVSIFDIFERIELIPLETTDESIFRDAQELKYHNGVVYILDWRKIFAFDATSGDLLFKIDDEGQGPQGYLHINDFEIDRCNDKILILDPMRRNLIEYDLSGRFVRSTKLPEIIHAYGSLRYLGDEVIAFMTFDDDNRLKFYDRRQSEIFSERLPVLPEDRNFFDIGLRFFSNANFIMRDLAFNNNVYEIFSDGTYSIAYIWDFGRLNNCSTRIQHLINPQSREEFMEQERRLRSSELVNYFFIAGDVNQTYRYARIVRRNQYVHLLHNIARERTYVFTEFSEGATFFPVFWGDEFIIGLGPFAGYREETIPDAILDDRNLAIKRNICEFDNPMLIKYWFRR